MNFWFAELGSKFSFSDDISDIIEFRYFFADQLDIHYAAEVENIINCPQRLINIKRYVCNSSSDWYRYKTRVKSSGHCKASRLLKHLRLLAGNSAMLYSVMQQLWII